MSGMPRIKTKDITEIVTNELLGLNDWNAISISYRLNRKLLDNFADRLNWKIICKNYCLPKRIINKYGQYMDWKGLCEHSELSEKLIEKYIDKVDWDLICKFQKYLSPKFYIKHFDNFNVYEICEHVSFTEKMLDALADKVNWDTISECQKLSPKQIDKYADKVNWEIVSMFRKLPEWLIEKYEDKVYWDKITSCQDISENFMIKHSDKVDWKELLRNKLGNTHNTEIIEHLLKNDIQVDYMCCRLSSNIPLRLIRQYQHKISWWYLIDAKVLGEDSKSYYEFADNFTEDNWYKFINEFQIDESILEKYIDYIDIEEVFKRQKNLSEKFIRKYINVDNAKAAITYCTLPEDILEKYITNQNAYLVLRFQNVSISFIEKYLPIISWWAIFYEIEDVPQDLIDRHIDDKDFNYNSLLGHKKVTEEFLKKYEGKYSWYFACKYQELSDEFVYSNLDAIMKDIKDEWKYDNQLFRYYQMYREKMEGTMNERCR